MSYFNARKNTYGDIGIPGVSDVYQVTTTSASAGPRDFWDRWFKPRSNVYRTVKLAEAALTGGINEVVFLSPESHSLAETLTWDKSMSHLVGQYPLSRMAQRSRMGMSTTFTPMISVTGQGNLFKNLYTMHGTVAGDYVGWAITGNRNIFENVHFAGPMIAAQGGHASYEGVTVTATDTYFKNCVFGTATIGRDETSPNVTLTVPSTGYGYTVFEDCIFQVFLTDGDPVFVSVANTSGVTWADFINCKFIAISSNMATAMTYAFKFSSGSTCGMSIDHNCEFINVSHLAATANMKYIWTPTVFAATADELNALSINSATY